MHKTPQILSSISLYKNQYIETKLDTLSIDGNTFEYPYFVKPHKKGVGIVPLDDSGIYLVYQYRHATKRHFWQIPMGMIDIGKTELETAKNELSQETGIVAEKFTKIGSIFAEPGVIDQEEIFFVAQGLTLSKNKPEKNEIGLRVRKFAYTQIDIMIHQGKIQCGFTLSALLLLNRNFFEQPIIKNPYS